MDLTLVPRQREYLLARHMAAALSKLPMLQYGARTMLVIANVSWRARGLMHPRT